MRKIKVLPIVVIMVLIAFGSISLAFLQKESNDFKLVKNLDIYYSLFRELNAFYVDGIDPDKLVKTSIDNMLNTLDPYTVFYSEADIDDFRFMTTGKYGGIGSMIRGGGEYIVLTQIYKGSPADKAELKAGDRLKAIDGFSLKGLSAEKVSNKLKGEPNTEITIVIDRQGKDITLTLKRERIAIPPVPYYGMIDDEVGYIRFTNFTQNCSKDVREALINLLEKQNAKKIILDVRSNPGGLLTEAAEVVNLFVGAGQEVVTTKGKVDQYNITYKTTRQPVDVDIPLVVMINRGTASAAEIVAGAIQDLDRGVVVGQKSYGKGLVQISRPLSYNTTLKVTTAKYYIPSGRCVQALDFTHRNEDGSVGFIPDSLISEFKTKNGRTVKDGGGINPDYNADIGQLSQITTELYLRSFIFDFATDYYWSHSAPSSPEDFVFSDKDYIEFQDFLKTKEFSYETATEDALERLTTIAKREKYYDINQEIFDELKLKLDHKLDNDLNLFKDEITRLIEEEIIGRYFYEASVIKEALKKDPQLIKAIDILKDQDVYSSTLAGNSGSLSSDTLSL
ncbi:MAG: S41 family peptidase [Bacteroidales bacterium]|nr:S41 family peptidase [Bacteroidales bacterium]